MAEPELGLTRSGPPSGGQDSSIRKNIVLPIYSPSGLHYGKKGHVLSGVERSGPPCGGPARVIGPGRADERAQRGADESTWRILGSGGPSVSGDTSSMNLPGSETAGLELGWFGRPGNAVTR
jgi:hypothetical protein